LPSADARRFQASKSATPAESTASTRLRSMTPVAGSVASVLVASTVATESMVSEPAGIQRSPST
jgi:hypothetical protein